MKAITQAVGMPVFFIRYNPDAYTDNKGIKSTITKHNKESLLVQWVKFALSQSPNSSDEFLRVVYLFYNGFDPANKDIQILDADN